MLAIACAADFHLAAVKFSFADNANTLVIQRLPVSESIFGAQDREAVIVTAEAAEEVVREMLQRDCTLSGLEISAPALEDAFLALTAHA